MTAIASTDVTLTLVRKDMLSRGKMNTWTVAFGDGALTYPTYGVPLPAIGSFGFGSKVDHVDICGQPGDGYLYKYDSTHHTIRIYQSAGFTPAGTVTVAGTVAAPVVTGTAAGQVFSGAGHTHQITVAATGGGTALTQTATGNISMTGGGVIDIPTGTASGTNAASAITATATAPTFAGTATLTGTAVAATALVEFGAVAIAATSLVLKMYGR